VPAILADINIQRHVAILRRIWESDQWRELWTSLALPVYTFKDVGLPAEASDAVVWHLGQQRQLLLITANRNKDGEDSLEATVRAANTPSSLPVFTLADANHFRQSKPYAERVAEKLLEYLLDIDAYRGTGRMYVP
jgi:hypothetical protein